VKFEKFNEMAELVGIVAVVASLRQEMTESEFAATYAKMLEQPVAKDKETGK